MISKIIGTLFVFIIVVSPAFAKSDAIDFENISFTMISSPDNGPDILPPNGSIHAYHNMIWPADNRMVTVTLEGGVSDKSGISSAYIRVDGGGEITLIDLGESGSFTVDIEVKASKGSKYLVELYATDDNPDKDGGPNSGLVDSTFIRVPHDMSAGRSER
jgi:hypothetical protein